MDVDDLHRHNTVNARIVCFVKFPLPIRILSAHHNSNTNPCLSLTPVCWVSEENENVSGTYLKNYLQLFIVFWTQHDTVHFLIFTGCGLSPAVVIRLGAIPGGDRVKKRGHFFKIWYLPQKIESRGQILANFWIEFKASQSTLCLVHFP